MDYTLPDIAFPIREIVNYLNFYHYGAAALILLIVLLLFTLAIILRKKILVSALLFLLSFMLPVPAMVGAYMFIEDANRRLDVSEFEVRRLNFVKGFVVKGTMQNNGQSTVRKEYLKVKLVRKDSFWPLEIINYYRPVQEDIFIETKTLNPKDSDKFDILVDTSKLKNPNSVRVYLLYKAF